MNHFYVLLRYARSGLMTVGLLSLILGISSTAVTGCSSRKSQFQIDKEERFEKLQRQEQEKERLLREQDEVKRQKFWNDQLKRYERNGEGDDSQ